MANKQLKTLTLPNAQGEQVTYELHPEWDNIENKPNSFPSELDTTLAISGVAADSKAVGDAINSLDTTIAVDENSDGNIEIRSYLPEQDYLQLDKSLTVEGAAAEGAAVGEALAQLDDNKVDKDSGECNDLYVKTYLNLVPDTFNNSESIYFCPSFINDDISTPKLEILGNSGDESVRISGLAYPEANNDAVCKGYADDNYMAITAQFAPAGYGLGSTDSKQLTSADDLNNCGANGFYSWALSPSNAPFSNGIMIVATYDWARKVQHILSAENGCAVQRIQYGASWGEWEWINPPMAVNTEYRTTERMLGKSVYKKVISYTSETMTSAGNSFSIPHGITGLDKIININAFTNSYTLPYSSASGLLNISMYNSTNLTMTNVGTTWGAGRTWYIELRYTKS